jgi:hypothetical protein
VAEAAFQGFRWDPELEKLAVLSRIKTIRCHVDARTAGKRAAARNASSSVRRLAHATPETPFNADDWKGITLRLPILTVDTTDGYIPGLDAIVSYALDHSECDRTHSSRRQGSP